MIERAFRGVTMSEMAAELGLTERTAQREMKRATELGLIDQVRDRLITALDKTATVYDAILDGTPEDLHKHSRGHKLKLDAANALNEGMGVFKRESVKTTKSVLETIASEHGDGDTWGKPDSGERLREQRRIAYVAPDTIDVEALPEREAL